MVDSVAGVIDISGAPLFAPSSSLSSMMAMGITFTVIRCRFLVERFSLSGRGIPSQLVPTSVVLFDRVYGVGIHDAVAVQVGF